MRTKIKTAHRVLVVKNHCVTSKIKCLKPNWFPFYHVHPWKVGCPFLWAFFSPQQLSVASTTEIFPRACYSFITCSLSSGLYQGSPKWMPTSSVTADSTRDNIQTKAKTTFHHLPCFAGIKYSLVWYVRNPWCPKGLFMRAWFGMLPLSLKQPQSFNSCGYCLCTEVPWMYPLYFQPSQQHVGLSCKAF